MAILKKGLAGEPVRRLQAKLGITADGQFGPATETALKEWQKKNGLAPDGVAGPDTFMSMGLYELVMLKPGTKGKAVKALQEKLGIAADGQFGAATEKAVREYQAKNGLAADGAAGPATLAQMKLFKQMTPETVKMSQVPASEIPPQTAAATGAAMASAGTAQASASSGLRSLWDTVTSIMK